MSTDPDQYAGISEIYDAWCLEVQEDIGFYVGMARGTETPVVELAAGTGRIAIPLALAGYDVIAVDRSTAMLDLLRAKAATAGAAERIDIRIGELVTPGVEGAYDRVLIPFRSLLHLRDDAGAESAVTADTALRLARYFAMSPAFWLKLQAGYDLRCAILEPCSLRNARPLRIIDL